MNHDDFRSGLYVHVPFCVKKCDYCDFYSFPGNEENTKKFVDSLEFELRSRSIKYKNYKITSIYFGGGTPSVLSPNSLFRILSIIRENFSVSGDCEITLEVNPEQGSLDYLNALADAGVNRVNVGIQSFQSERLSFLGRWHDPERYDRILEDLSLSRIQSRGADLIYGIPGQSKSEFYMDLERLFQANLEHISLYSLTSESGTPYDFRIRRGEESPNERIQVELLRELPGHMNSKGYSMYEVSNFAKSGKHSRHNTSGWLYYPYLGFGPGAHGFDGMYRWENPTFNRWSQDPMGAELNEHRPQIEFPLGILRILSGIPLLRFREILGPSGLAAAKEVFRLWSEKGYGEIRIIKNETGEEDSLFYWSDDAFLFLNDRIFEMVEALDVSK